MKLINRGSVLRPAIAVALLAATLTIVDATLPITPDQPSAALEPSIRVGTDPGECFLEDAILAANNGIGFDTCENPNGLTLITIDEGNVANVPGAGSRPGYLAEVLARDVNVGGAGTAMPLITADITIEGIGTVGIFSGFTGAERPRAFAVAPGGSLTLRNVTVSGFRATGRVQISDPFNTGQDEVFIDDAFGGAIYAEGPVVLDRVAMLDNQVIGRDNPSRDGGPAYFRKDGGSATGGAIYSTSTVTVTGSVFANNAAIAGDGGTGFFISTAGASGPIDTQLSETDQRRGGNGGHAAGADIALATTATATISDTLFVDSIAIGGDGGFGHTPDEVKDLQRRTAQPTGATGFCSDPLSQAAADGGDGADGRTGYPAANGGHAGNATGVIFGGSQSAIDLESVAIVRASATAGGAGQVGVPGRGGRGGDGGDAASCSDGGFGPTQRVVIGIGGDAGNPGDNGTAGRPGDRGRAVVVGNGQILRMNNVTIDGVAAEVRPDVADPDFPQRESALEAARTRNDAFGQRGCNFEDPNDTSLCGARADAFGEPSDKLDDLIVEADPGGAALVGGSGGTFVAHSTLIGGTTTPVTEPARFKEPENWIFEGAVDLTATILRNLGGGACDSEKSLGFNVDNVSCIATPIASDTAVAFPPPVVTDLIESGTVLTTDAFGKEWRMVTRRPRQTGPPAGSPVDRGADAPCPRARTGELLDDARGVPRSGPCDTGAHELYPVDVGVDVQLSEVIAAPLNGQSSLATIDVTLGDPNQLDVGARLRIEVTGTTGVFRVGTPTGLLDRTSDTTIVVPVLPTAASTPQQYFLRILPDGTSGNVTVKATLLPGSGDPRPNQVLEDQDSGPIVFDPNLVVDQTTNGDFLRCTTDHPIDFVATTDGRSQIRQTIARAFPEGTPVLEPNNGSAEISPLIDGVRWTIPEFALSSDRYELTVEIDGSDYQNGDVVRSSIQFTQADSFEPFTFPGPDTATVLPDTTFTVDVLGLDGIQPGETRNATLRVTNTGTESCNDVVGVESSTSITAVPSAAVRAALVAGDTTTGVIGDLAAGQSSDRSFEFTAPATDGEVEFTTTLTMPGSDGVAPFVYSRRLTVETLTTTTTTTTTSTLPTPPPPPPPPSSTTTTIVNQFTPTPSSSTTTTTPPTADGTTTTTTAPTADGTTTTTTGPTTDGTTTTTTTPGGSVAGETGSGSPTGPTDQLPATGGSLRLIPMLGAVAIIVGVWLIRTKRGSRPAH